MSTCNLCQRGGSSSNHTTATPVLSYPLQPGASNQRESALITNQNMNTKQQAMINTHGGKVRQSRRRKSRQRKTRRRKTKRRKSRRRTRGGSQCNVSSDPVTVPSFGSSSVSPVNANTSSMLGNSTSMQASAHACNDCYATGTCGVKNG